MECAAGLEQEGAGQDTPKYLRGIGLAGGAGAGHSLFYVQSRVYFSVIRSRIENINDRASARSSPEAMQTPAPPWRKGRTWGPSGHTVERGGPGHQ